MISVFDIEKLVGLLRDFYEITQIRITVFDENLQELVSYPEHVAPFCQIIRSCPAGKAACIQCDKDACATATRRGKTYIYQCHAGLTEAISPLRVNRILVGYLMFGHVFSYSSAEEGWSSLQQRCKDIPVDHDALRAACNEMPLITQDYVRSATQILHAVASYLVLERMATLQEDKLAVRLDTYLSAHYMEEFTVQDICDQFEIGKTQLYRIAKELYGCGIAQHIRKLRMDLARSLLTERKSLTISDIASACGYGDYNYFISVFSREVGCPPMVYRKSQNTNTR